MVRSQVIIGLRFTKQPSPGNFKQDEYHENQPTHMNFSCWMIAQCKKVVSSDKQRRSTVRLAIVAVSTSRRMPLGRVVVEIENTSVYTITEK